MLILAIETSCDETAAAVLRDKKILSNVVSSQIKIHAKYGGVVPEAAARAHTEVIMPVIEKALSFARVKKEQIDLLSVTFGPGLITSLMIGVDTAKTLAFVMNKPLLAVNHLEGHIYANFALPVSNLQFPLLCLIVSGGHTELVLMPKHLKYKVIGETRDDAAGEAFDKVAKLLNLGYPGGPIISRLADLGNSKAFAFPRPMIQSLDFDFSFSGLKTDVLRLVRRRHLETSRRQKKDIFKKQELQDIAASFQAAVVDVLVFKTAEAAKKFKVKTVAISGGVAANRCLRQKIQKMIKKELPSARLLLPPPNLCSDNAAMIGLCAFYKARAGIKTAWDKIRVEENARLD